MLATTRTAGAAPSSELPEGLALASHYKTVVEEVGACALPGVSVKYDTFMPCMWRAVATGFVRHEHAVFVAEGLRYGFKAGIDVAQLTGHCPSDAPRWRPVTNGRRCGIYSLTRVMGWRTSATFAFDAAYFPDIYLFYRFDLGTFREARS